MKKGLIIFDFDGTLVDTEVHLRPMFAEKARDLLGIEDPVLADAEAVRLYKVYHSTMLGIGIALNKENPKEWAHQQKTAIMQQFLDELPQRLDKSPETKEMLTRLTDDDWELAILSHSERPYISTVMEHMELTPLFNPRLVLGNDCTQGLHKNEERTYHFVLDRLGTPVLRKYMVEDLAENLKAPYDMGFRTVLVGTALKPDDDSYIHEKHPDVLAFGRTVLNDPEESASAPLPTPAA